MFGKHTEFKCRKCEITNLPTHWLHASKNTVSIKQGGHFSSVVKMFFIYKKSAPNDGNSPKYQNKDKSTVAYTATRYYFTTENHYREDLFYW